MSVSQRNLAALVALLLAPIAATRQSPADKFTAHSNLVLLPTRVQTKKGKTIFGLKAEQFIVEDNRVRQNVQVDEESISTGLSLVVVVQCSRSAPKEFVKMRGLGAMVDEIVGDAPHEVALLAYGEAPYVLDDFSSRPDAVRNGLSKLKDCGSFHAATIDAVYYATNMLRRRPNKHYRRAILLISEMRDYGSRSKLHEVVAELGINDTVIYSVTFSPAADALLHPYPDSDDDPKPPVFKPPPAASPPDPAVPEDPDYREHPPRIILPPQLLLVINALKRNTALELAGLSGGENFNFATQTGFERILERISNQIHDYYLLSFQPPPGPIMTYHALRVRIENNPNAVVQTRKSYWSGIYDSAPDR